MPASCAGRATPRRSPFRVSRSRRTASAASQSGPSRSGPRWPTTRCSRRCEEFDDRQPVADRLPLGVGQDRPHLVPGRRASARPTIKMPRAVHPQVGVQGQVAVGPGEQVLAPADDLDDGRRRGRWWRAAAPGGRLRSAAAGERVVQAARGQPDGVTLGHRPIIPRVGPRGRPGRGWWRRGQSQWSASSDHASPAWTAAHPRITNGSVIAATAPRPVVTRMSAVRPSPRPMKYARL